ncbi:hypothetical protein KR222_000098 [Zaprionus bogoriensis]|nr:hypothetical protein KR222_000098 [Zaprionus bogoriensis]
MEHIIVGEKITISRSDGRVHTAMVDAKHDDMQSITVAWTEGCKLMGKEIPWPCIVALNPHLKSRSMSDENQLKAEKEAQFLEYDEKMDED